MEDEDKKKISNIYVSLKEHFEKLWIEREKNITLQFRSNTERLDATARVIEHRLEVLNHAHEQSVQDREEFLVAKEFKTFKGDLDKWQGFVNNAITTFNTRYEFRINAATWISIISLIVGISSLVIIIIKRG